MVEARGLHTGEDAVTFFSKYSTVGDCPVKFLHLNRAPAQVCIGGWREGVCAWGGGG
jgi:hypothetical protein